jgi:hypothetical protein
MPCQSLATETLVTINQEAELDKLANLFAETWMDPEGWED